MEHKRKKLSFLLHLSFLSFCPETEFIKKVSPLDIDFVKAKNPFYVFIETTKNVTLVFSLVSLERKFSNSFLVKVKVSNDNLSFENKVLQFGRIELLMKI